MPQAYVDFTATWIIKNFFFFGRENIITASPHFIAKNIDMEEEWQISIDDRKDDCGQYIFLQLYKYGKDYDKTVTLDIEMELCNSENVVLCTTEKKKGVEFHGGGVYTFEKVMSVDELNQKIKNDPSGTLILRCRMFTNRVSEIAESLLDRSCTMITTIIFDELSYTRNVTYFENPNWSNKLALPIDESLKLVINIKTLHDDILFEIRPENDITSFKRIKCEITLLDYEYTEKISNHDVFNFFSDSEIWRFPSFLKKSLFEKGTQSLNLKFYFAVAKYESSRLLKAHETNYMSLLSSPNSLKNIPSTTFLIDDLCKMLFNKEYSDVCFRVEDEVISAHKNILAARSPVFSAMFNLQMAENKTGQIDIEDMDVHTLKLFLKFIYIGELENLSYDIMLELLLAAEKYQVPSLKEKCSRYLKQHISLDNVCDVVSVADMVGEQILKMAAIGYIKENYAKVFSSSKWSVFIKKNVELCAEILYNFSENLKAK